MPSQLCVPVLLLLRGNYELARDEAALLIESGTYTLCSSPSDLTAMYTYDGVNLGMDGATGSSEAIFQLISASTNELPSATGTRFLPYQGWCCATTSRLVTS